MKAFFVTLCLLCASVLAADTTAPTLPDSVKLANGAVLKKISVVRWTSDGVVLKHAGGADPIRFAHIDASQRATFEALAKQAKKETGAVIAKAAEPVTYSGQAFIATRGAGSYKIGAMLVYAFPAEAAALFETYSTVELPRPLAKVITDADGKFSFVLPGDTKFLLFAQGRRLLGKEEELYEWRIASDKVSDPKTLLLSNGNHGPTHTRVKIAE